MNAVTYRRAYALYPKAYFEERNSLVCDTKEIRHEEAINKYEARGWTIMMHRKLVTKDLSNQDAELRPEDR